MSDTFADLKLELQTRRQDLAGIKHAYSRYGEVINGAIAQYPEKLWLPTVDYLLTVADQRRYSLAFLSSLTQASQLRRIWMGSGTVTNLCLNPGFETAGAGGDDVFGDWTETKGDGTIERVTGPRYAGSYAAKLTAGATADTRVAQDITTVNGATYALTFYSRGDTTNEGRYHLWNQDSNNFLIDITGTGNKTTTWKRVSKILVTKCTTVGLGFRCPSASTGYAFFDGVELYKMPERFQPFARWQVISTGSFHLAFDEKPPEANRPVLLEYVAPYAQLSSDTDATTIDKTWLLSRAMTLLILEADPAVEPPELLAQQLAYWDNLRQTREQELMNQLPIPAVQAKTTPWGQYV